VTAHIGSMAPRFRVGEGRSKPRRRCSKLWLLDERSRIPAPLEAVHLTSGPLGQLRRPELARYRRGVRRVSLPAGCREFESCLHSHFPKLGLRLELFKRVRPRSPRSARSWHEHEHCHNARRQVQERAELDQLHDRHGWAQSSGGRRRSHSFREDSRSSWPIAPPAGWARPDHVGNVHHQHPNRVMQSHIVGCETDHV
jgi:hypothetical protein